MTGFCRTIRGLDPDKIAGGVPAFVIYDSEHGTIEEFPYARAEAAEWPHAERQAFLDCLGIACMREPGEALIFARENKIRVCELRVGGTDHCQVELERWREAVPDGRLSFHLPDLQHQDEDNTRLSEAVELAIALGCVRTTFHFPRATPAQMQSPVFRSRLKSETIRLLAPLAQAGIAIGLENLHTYPNRERTYGCNLEECQSWLEELAPELPNLGFHFDLGHARNNYPFSSTENVADYFSRLGRVTNGIHLHQVSVLPSGEMQNHRPIKEIFGKLIPLSSLFLAWKSRQIPREVPIILEIRGGAAESWQLIADYLRAGASQSR